MSRDANIREFTRQAESFEAPNSYFGDVEILDWIASHVPTESGDRLLDVAGGTGRLGRHLGRDARLTVIADLTPAMLREGAAAARAEGRADVVFVQADAEALPFPDGQFDVVVSRFALHHMNDPGAAIGEMARACAPGGTVALVDMVADEGSSGGRQDELERLRDPSHTRCLADGELLGLMADAGLEPLSRSERRKDLPVRQWLGQAGPSAENAWTVTQALEAEAGGGPSTGLNGHRTDDGLAIAHRYLLAAARKRDGEADRVPT